MSNDAAGFAFATDRSVAPPDGAFDAGLRPDPFPDRAASLLPGLLAATRTGLPPASDDELTTTDQPPTRSTSRLLGAREWLSGPFWGASGRSGALSATFLGRRTEPWSAPGDLPTWWVDAGMSDLIGMYCAVRYRGEAGPPAARLWSRRCHVAWSASSPPWPSPGARWDRGPVTPRANGRAAVRPRRSRLRPRPRAARHRRARSRWASPGTCTRP